jgi:transposase-like protein
MRRGVRRIKIFAREILPRLPQESVFQHISEAEGAEDMTRRQYNKRADEFYTNDILTPLERRRKALTMSKETKPLTDEKISEVKELIEDGATIAETAARTGVSKSSVCRIKSGQLTAEGKPEKPKSAPKPKPEPVFTALEVAPDPITQRELDTLRALIGQAVKAFAGIECATAADSYNLGQTFGLLTAAQMILEGDGV